MTVLMDTDAVVRELRDLSRESLTADAGAVVWLLADDLDQDDGRLEQWAAVDLVGTLARDENIDTGKLAAAAHGSRRSRGRWIAATRRLTWLTSKPPLRWLVRGGNPERTVDAVLGVLVFVPLLVTWFGLARASAAYSRLATREPDKATEPFLQLWERGFDGNLSPWLRFGNVASTAVLFIGLLLVTSAYHAMARHRSQTVADEQRAAIAERTGKLVLVLVRAQVVVNARRAVTPADFTAALGDSAKRLRGMLKTAAEVEDRAVEVLERTEHLTEGLGEAASRLTTASDRTAAASTAAEQRVLQGVDLLQKAQDQTGAMVGDMVRKSSEALRTAHEEAETVVRDVVSRGTAAVGDMVRQGTEDLTALQTAGLAAVETSVSQNRDVVRNGVADLRRSQEAVVAAVDATRTAMAEAAVRNTEAVGGVGARVEDAGGKVTEVLQRLAKIQQDVNDRTELAVAAADEVVKSLTAVVDETRMSIVQLGRVVDHWDAAAAHWENAAEAVERGTRADFGRRRLPTVPGQPSPNRPGQ